jgi:hypothetical protein
MVQAARVRRYSALGLLLAAGAAAPAANAAPHTFDLTYRAFGKVSAESQFKTARGYEVRDEGCYAKHSDEAICGFTLRALQPLTVTNLQNAAHGSSADGTPIRTCCMFVQQDNRGYPITPQGGAPAGVAILNVSLRPGQEIGLMLRVPDYRQGPPLYSITFSHGAGDPGLAFPEHIAELP